MDREVSFAQAARSAQQDHVTYPCGVPLSPESYYCVLDVQPTQLVPERLVRSEIAGEPSGPLVLNPDCGVSRDGRPPEGIASMTPFTERFSTEVDVAWVRDPATHAFAPFWLGPEVSAALARLRPGDAADVVLTQPLLQTLRNAHVLVDRGWPARRRRAWEALAARAREAFREGFAPIGGLIHPYHVGALRRYYRCLVRRGALRLGDSQSPLRYNVHNESVARYFHHQLRQAVSDLAGEPLKPTYVYFVAYQAGAELPLHRDRPDCEVSVTLLLDHSPEPELQSPWPLHLHLSQQDVSIFQGIGDGLLYRGRRILHHRGRLPAGHMSASLLFHYVRADFSVDRT
jgi:hypothetical protein